MYFERIRGMVPADTLLIHGNLASNTWWEPAIGCWAGMPRSDSRQGSLIAAEWRGCGRSSAPATEAELDMKNLAHDYVELVRSLDLLPSPSKINVIGHSTGGLIALLAMLEAPELFGRAVLLDPVSPAGAELSPELLAALEQMSKDRNLTSLVMGSTIHGNNPDSALFQKIVDDAFQVSPLIWQGIPRTLSRIDYRNEVRAVRQPTLVLHGEHDAILPMSGSEELAKLLPEGRFLKLDGQGHSCNVENPARFVEIAERFLFG